MARYHPDDRCRTERHPDAGTHQRHGHGARHDVVESASQRSRDGDFDNERGGSHFGRTASKGGSRLVCALTRPLRNRPLPLYTRAPRIALESGSVKPDIHPEYTKITARCSCGNVIETRSTLGSDIHLEVCSACHPFYTGTQKIMDTGGRVERFRRRFGNVSSNV